MTTPYLQDADVTLYHGDALAVLRELPSESVDCIATSPPYWGLRDYGTGRWEGGDEGCDHAVRPSVKVESSTLSGGKATSGHQREGYGAECGRCGATRLDQQIGLESTPEKYVERMVEVFREVRRVLAAHGTCWVNLGDSYATAPAGNFGKDMPAPADGGVYRENKPAMDWGRAGLKQKDLCGIPWRVAFALQADGWYLRSDIIWSKPNPMPESVTDRPTKAHEYVFLLSKQPRYFFDKEAVREKNTPGMLARSENGHTRGVGSRDESRGDLFSHAGTKEILATGRNIRSVWQIATQSYPEAHFATFPEELARRAIAAGCPEQVCRVCGVPRARITETELVPTKKAAKTFVVDSRDAYADNNDQGSNRQKDGHKSGWRNEVTTLGFTDCGHADYRPGIVLDPFIGSGTVGFVARKLGRRSIGIDLSADYLEMADRRLAQQSLLAEVAS